MLSDLYNINITININIYNLFSDVTQTTQVTLWVEETVYHVTVTLRGQIIKSVIR